MDTVCSPWAVAEDVQRLGLDCGDADAYQLDDGLAMSSDLLWRWTAHTWPGVCDAVDRPCAAYRSGHSTPTWSWHGNPGPGVSADGWRYHPSWGSCSSHPPGRGCCCGPAELMLTAGPVVEVLEVWVDGEQLAESEYRIDEGWLVRLPDPDGVAHSWPCCQRVDLPRTEPGTFEVVYHFGGNPPAGGVRSAAVLGCELAKALAADDDCALPPALVQLARQGATFDLDDGDDVRKLLPTQIRWWLDAVNPTGGHVQADVWAPNLSRGRRIPGV